MARPAFTRASAEIEVGICLIEGMPVWAMRLRQIPGAVRSTAKLQAFQIAALLRDLGASGSFPGEPACAACTLAAGWSDVEIFAR